VTWRADICNSDRRRARLLQQPSSAISDAWVRRGFAVPTTLPIVGCAYSQLHTRTEIFTRY
jgi:hypothetical protein